MAGGGWGDRDRARVLDAVAASGVGNLAVIVGDIHKFRAFDVVRSPGSYDPATGALNVAGHARKRGAREGSPLRIP